ncbi:MAG: zinc ABC transporter substrate-binding protein [Desulfobacteraceae bacterium]|jgi:zinc transport system substrate-binding protein
MFKKIIIIIFVLFLVQSYANGQDKLKIVTSIAPLAYFIENIGGSRVDVTTLVPPGGNPHTYEPTPRQMNVLSNADLFVKAGSGIEFELIWMKRIGSLNKNMPVCDSSGGITLIDTAFEEDHEYGQEKDDNHDQRHHGGKDPHIWLSPVNAITIAENIRNSLAETDPSGSDYYYKNTLSLIEKLKTLNEKVTIVLKDISKRQFFIFHPAWAYFARDFNLEQIPIEFSGKEPTPERLGKLVKKAIKLNINVIFSSPQFSKKSADVIATEIKGKVVFIDPMSKDYIKNLEHTAHLLQENL